MGKDWISWGLEAAANAAVAPVMAAVDFVTNGGEFSKDGIDHAVNTITPGLADIDDLLNNK